MKALGLYIHIPFCRSKCLYCDFFSVPTRDSEKMMGYTHRLCADLSSRADLCKEYEVDTVYLGGGTPTVLPLACLEEILKTCMQSNPSHRYQNCEELLYAFEHHQEYDVWYCKQQKNKILIFSMSY